ncbi:MAG: hypothetical protein RSE41_05885, partial [Clostridia bacterium]
MNKKFKIILIVILILVVIICGVLIYKLVNKNNIENNIENNTENNDKVNIYKSDILDEKEDGTMFNISDKIREEKNIKKLSGVKVN